jgi:hypothetical protein
VLVADVVIDAVDSALHHGPHALGVKYINPLLGRKRRKRA